MTSPLARNFQHWFNMLVTKRFPLLYRLFIIAIIFFVGEIHPLFAQQPTKVVVAGPQYLTSKKHQRKWGKSYRQEWATPVQVKVVQLDTLAGGLTPYQAGGGRQSRSLRLHDANGREYVLRSIDKTYTKALPEVTRGTFIEKIANDQVSIAHPYAAVTIAPMAEAAGILHTNPQIIYVPKQDRLGKFSDDYGDQLYLFEERPDENWENASNFANSKNIISTEKLRGKLEKDNHNQVDQHLFIRSRLFDFFIGDWGRHGDQWRWAETESGKQDIYKPVPRDRDQAYTKFEGRKLKQIKSIAAGYLESFGPEIKHVTSFNYPARNLDRRMANEMVLDDWVKQATELQAALTDNVIESAIKQLPPEVYPISGPDIVANLKSRRDHLVEYATEYYEFIAKEVDIPLTDEDEVIVVDKFSDDSLSVKVYDMKKGERAESPFYERIFRKHETKEIRIFSNGGNDQFVYTGNSHPGIRVRTFDEKNKEHAYEYEWYRYNKKGFKPLLFYSNDDHLYVGIEYGFTNFKWKKYPYASKQKINAKYSLQEKAPSFTWEGKSVAAFGKWDFDWLANVDPVRWYNFYGLGNETIDSGQTVHKNRLRTRENIFKAGISRHFGKHNFISLSGFYQTVQIRNDSVFEKSLLPVHPDIYNTKQFAGAVLDYNFVAVNDSLLPTKGFGANASISYTANTGSSNSVTKYWAEMRGYIPLSKALSIALRAGAATLSGEPEIYQYNYIGGRPTLRGNRRFRYWGKSVAYEQNDLRWVKDVRGYLYSGKIGLDIFYDAGRVWMPGENSNTWHYGYGGGIILAPFNKIAIELGYGTSKDGGVPYFRILTVL